MHSSNQYPGYGAPVSSSPVAKPRSRTPLVVGLVLGGLALAGLAMFAVLAAGAVTAWKSISGNTGESDDGQLPIVSETGQFENGPFKSVFVIGQDDTWGYGLDGIGTRGGVWVHGKPAAYRGWTPVGDYGATSGHLFSQVPEGVSEQGPLGGYLSSIREGADAIVYVPARETLVWVNSYSGRVLTCTQASYTTSSSPDGPSTPIVDPYGQLVPLARLQRSPICVAVSGRGDWIAVGCRDWPEYPDQNWPVLANPPTQASLLLLAWGPDGAEIRHELRGPKGNVSSVEFSTDGTKLYSGSNDHKIHVWNVANGKLDTAIEVEAPVVSISVDAQQPRLLYCTERGHIVVLDLSSGERRPLQETVAEPPSGNSRYTRNVRAEFSPNGALIAVLKDKRLEIVGRNNFEVHGSRSFESQADRSFLDRECKDISWSPDGKRVAVALRGKCYLLGTELR